MSLRRSFIFYLLFVHVLIAAFAAYGLRDDRIWLLAVEAVLLLSFLLARKLLRAFLEPLELLQAGAEFIKEQDFTSEFRKVGRPEMDRLIEVYNGMIDHLREERLRLQEQHYFLEKIITASPSGILIFDFDGSIAAANPSAERILQMPVERLLGKRLSEFATPFTDALHRLPVGEAAVVPLRGQRRLKCQKSEFHETGFPRTFILLEELTEELRRSEKAAYEKLIRLMSHEVNNSIGAVNSLLHSCLNYKSQLREADRWDFEQALQVSIQRAEHLNSFMRSFAEVVKIPVPALEPVDLRRLLEDIVLLLRSETQRRDIQWAWEVQEPLERVKMDKHQMEQALVNILKNAIEAIGDRGAITIRLGRKDGRPFLIIEDTGNGITPEVRQNLFTPFFSTKENGQGLGLTLVQEILSRHRFEFSLDRPPGGPTQFAIYFGNGVRRGE